MQFNGKRYHSLSTRIVVQFCLFTVVLSFIFGALSFLLMYVLEDNFIEKDIARQANRLITEFEASGRWSQPENERMSLHFSKHTFPEEIKEMALLEPRRIEFYGEQGRHYHAMALPGYPEVYLLAEVSADLQVRKIRKGIIVLLVVSTVLVSLIACLLAWLVARKTTKPLKQLAELVDGVAPEQIPKSFAAQFPHNEVGILAVTLEHTLGRISAALSREKHFTRDVSHELRTPLAVIKNAVELARSQKAGVVGQEAQPNEKLLNRIYDAATQMERTVQALLMLAREEHSATAKQPISLLSVLEKSILDNHLLLNDKPVDVEVSGRCDTLLHASPDMLKVLLDNLLSNAFQYTDSGEVLIDFADDSLIIQDSGPGIDPGISDKLTEAGIKGAISTGFGFGLSIVKRLCEHQGWQFQVESQQGTRVTVRFAQ